MDVPSSCYALLALVELSLATRDHPLTREDIARKHSLLPNPLARSLSRLSRAGLVRSVPGRGGGHYLALDSGEISIAAVLTAVSDATDEALTLPACAGADRCERYGNCWLGPVWQGLRDRLDRVLRSVTLADLSAQQVDYGSTAWALAAGAAEAEQLPAAIVADEEGRVVLANRQAEALGGWRSGDVRGHPLSEVLPLQHQGRRLNYADLLARVARGESVGLAPGTVLQRPDGGLCLISGVASSMADEDEGKGLRLAYWDVTERNELEQRLVAVNQLEASGVLVGKLARQFCDLLTGVVGSVSLARAQAGSASEVWHTLEWAESAALVADVLLQQVLTQTGEHAPSSGPVSLPSILTEAVRVVTHGTAVRASLRLDADLHSVTGDVALLRQALQNLLLNAVEAMPDGGALSVSATNLAVPPCSESSLAEGEYVRLTIEDSGSGVPVAVKDMLFQPYHSTKKGRSGLGLLAVAAIVREHGGTFALRPAAHNGTIAEVVLPAAGAMRPSTVQAKAGADGRRALLVEDEPIVVTVLSRMLESVGYETDATANLGEMESKLSQALWAGHPYAVVLVDTGLAGETGLDGAAARLHQLDPSVRLIATSPYGGTGHPTDAPPEGFAAILRKPFTFDDLKQVLRAQPAPGLPPG